MSGYSQAIMIVEPVPYNSITSKGFTITITFTQDNDSPLFSIEVLSLHIGSFR